MPNETTTKSGFLLVNKPKNWTSHDVVGYLRKITGIKKIGHAGTLDPFATGLLIVGVGREATKNIDTFKALPKEYIATLKLGATSDTQDSTGIIKIKKSCCSETTPRAWQESPTTEEPCPEQNKEQISEKEVKNILQSFLGKQKQTPPMFSAKKINGKKLYELARKGIEIERQPNNIEISVIDLLEIKNFKLKIKVQCSTGTYIRTLCHDIGEKLKIGAYCDELERTSIGSYSLVKAHEPNFFTKENIAKFYF